MCIKLPAVMADIKEKYKQMKHQTNKKEAKKQTNPPLTPKKTNQTKKKKHSSCYGITEW